MESLNHQVRCLAREIENGLSCPENNNSYTEMLFEFEELASATAFSDLKHLKDISQNELKTCREIFNVQHFSRCCRRLISSLTSETLTKFTRQHVMTVENIFMKGPCIQTLFVLCTEIAKIRLGIQLHKCVSLLEKWLTSRRLAEIFWQESHTASTDPQLSDQLITVIVSLPEVVTNKLQKETSDIFFPDNYVPLVCKDIERTLMKVRDSLAANENCSLEFVSQIFGRLSLAGHSDAVWVLLLPNLYHRVKNDYLWCRVCERLVTGVPSRCLESTVAALLRHLPWYGLSDKFLGDSVVKDQTVHHLLCTKLIFHRHSQQVLLLHNIIGYLASSHTRRHLFVKVLQNLLEVWGDGSSIKHTSYEQHVFLTRAVLIAIRHLNTQEKETYKEAFLRDLMPGVSAHIGHSSQKMRTLGMVVAELLTKTVDPSGPKLDFQSEPDKEIEALLSQTEIPREPDVEELEKLFGKTTIVDVPDPIEHEMDSDPKPNSEKTNSTDTAGASDLDSDDDLEPYDMSHDLPQTKVKVPKYIRECMEGLIVSDEPDKLEICLREAESLIRKKPDGLHEVAVEFSKILLHLDNKTGYPDFITRRFAALVALTVHSPANVADYLCEQFYERNYNLRQRLDILEVLAAGAQELSKPETRQNKDKAKKIVELSQDIKIGDTSSWREIVDARIQAKTRRFAKGRTQPLPQESANKFASVAGHFFYPLMKHFDRKENTFDLLGSDTLVLGRLVYTLGMILYAALHAPSAKQMGITLLQFTWALRYHADVFVRQSVLFATSMIIMVIPSHHLISDLQMEVIELKMWLEETADKDTDSECRKMALQGLVLLENAIKQEFEGETSVT